MESGESRVESIIGREGLEGMRQRAIRQRVRDSDRDGSGGRFPELGQGRTDAVLELPGPALRGVTDVGDCRSCFVERALRLPPDSENHLRLQKVEKLDE
jgi:hypothetical protein